MRSEVMLYRPLTDEVEEDQIEEFYNEMINGRRKISVVKHQIMEHLESVEEARYYAEQMKKELRLEIEENAAAKLDPTGIQDNEENEDEGWEENEDIVILIWLP